MDSSVVLAIAAQVARRNGLEAPLPVTLRFPDAPSTQEDDWQERVIRHIGIDDWLRIELHDELDIVGPYSTAALLANGVAWPANNHLLAPILERVPGATVLTGVDGDGLFSDWRWHAAMALITAPRTMGFRELLPVGLALAPPAGRRAYLRRRRPPPDEVWPSWLTPVAAAAFRQRLLEDEAAEPFTWSARVAWYARRRYVRHARDAIAATTSLFGGTAAFPLLDDVFLAAVARSHRVRGFASRSEAYAELAGDLLPTSLIERRDKAIFHQVFIVGPTRAFAETWDGSGLPVQLVNAEQARAEWLLPQPDFRSAMLLQQAWIRAHVSATVPPGNQPKGVGHE